MPLPQRGRPVILSFVASGLVFGALFEYISRGDHICAAFRCFSTDAVTFSSTWREKKKKLIVESENPFVCKPLLALGFKATREEASSARCACAYLRCI